MINSSLWVGIGCNHGIPCAVVAAAINHIFEAHGLTQAAIAAICTVDHKLSEAGLVEFCRDRQLLLRGFSAEALRAVIVPNPSAIASHTIGTPSVAEAAAILAYQEWKHARETALFTIQPSLSSSRPLLSSLTDSTSQTTPSPLLVPKQIFRLVNQTSGVTLAVAGTLEPPEKF